MVVSKTSDSLPICSDVNATSFVRNMIRGDKRSIAYLDSPATHGQPASTRLPSQREGSLQFVTSRSALRL